MTDDLDRPLPVVRVGQGQYQQDVFMDGLNQIFGGESSNMQSLKQIQRGRKVAPRRALLYGTHGIGKSTFGSMADKAIFIQTEDGLEIGRAHV